MKKNKVVPKSIEKELERLGMYTIYSEEEKVWKIYQYGGGLLMTTFSLEKFMSYG